MSESPWLDFCPEKETIKMLPVINTLMFRQWVQMLGITFFPSLEVVADSRTCEAGPHPASKVQCRPKELSIPLGWISCVWPHRLAKPDGVRTSKVHVSSTTSSLGGHGKGWKVEARR